MESTEPGVGFLRGTVKASGGALGHKEDQRRGPEDLMVGARGLKGQMEASGAAQKAHWGADRFLGSQAGGC